MYRVHITNASLGETLLHSTGRTSLKLRYGKTDSEQDKQLVICTLIPEKVRMAFSLPYQPLTPSLLSSRTVFSIWSYPQDTSLLSRRLVSVPSKHSSIIIGMLIIKHDNSPIDLYGNFLWDDQGKRFRMTIFAAYYFISRL